MPIDHTLTNKNYHMNKRMFALWLFLSMVTLGIAQQANTPLWLRYPAISPDGSTIAFSYKGDIFKVSAKGGIASILTTNSAYDFMPVWSPDGKTIAFASNRYGNFDVFAVLPSLAL